MALRDGEWLLNDDWVTASAGVEGGVKKRFHVILPRIMVVRSTCGQKVNEFRRYHKYFYYKH